MMSIFKKIISPNNNQSKNQIELKDRFEKIENSFIKMKPEELKQEIKMPAAAAVKIPAEIKKHNADEKYLKQLIDFNGDLEKDIEFFKKDIFVGQEEVEKVKKSISDARKIQLELIQKRNQLLKIQQSVHIVFQVMDSGLNAA